MGGVPYSRTVKDKPYLFTVQSSTAVTHCHCLLIADHFTDRLLMDARGKLQLVQGLEPLTLPVGETLANGYSNLSTVLDRLGLSYINIVPNDYTPV
jgi:hypothetical protein